jgi:two-component system, NarL family, invasion response regulator UvrY
MRILIVDDHAIVRKGLIQILEDEPEKFVVGEAKDAEEALEKVRQERWDLVILDISMPGRSGLEVLAVITEQKPGLPVLILSTYSEDQYTIRVLQSGAAGYLNKQSAPEELIIAIRKIRNGEKYVSPSQTSLLLSKVVEKREETKDSIETLSNRELEILLLIAKGNTLTEIAQTISLSIRTVSTYRTRILNKLKLKNNLELISYAIHNHLVE